MTASFVTKPLIELHLLLFSESQLSSGLALVRRLGEFAGYSAAIAVVNESPDSLVRQVEIRLEENAGGSPVPRVQKVAPEPQQILAYLSRYRGVRIVLMPGLDQLNDLRKELLREIRSTVVCFEPHTGLTAEPAELWLIGQDQQHVGDWFAERLVPYAQLRSITQEELLAAGEAPDASAKVAPADSDWVLCIVDRENLDATVKSCRAIMEAAVGPVLLIRSAASRWQQFYSRELPNLVARVVPQMEREQRQALAADLQEHSKLSFEFVALICASTFLASFGLIQNSAAVIIGAMLVAPLMTPILGAGLSLTHGNRPLFLNSIKTIAMGFMAALATSFGFGLLVHLLSPAILDVRGDAVRLTEEMWARTQPTAIDFLVGLVGGSAAAFARTRGHLADALAGAAIAAALVPPIATAGLNLSLIPLELQSPTGAVTQFYPFYGPLLLFAVNVLAIMIGSAMVLWACGARSDHRHSTRERWSTRMFMLLLSLLAMALVWMLQHPPGK